MARTLLTSTVELSPHTGISLVSSATPVNTRDQQVTSTTRAHDRDSTAVVTIQTVDDVDTIVTELTRVAAARGLNLGYTGSVDMFSCCTDEYHPDPLLQVSSCGLDVCAEVSLSTPTGPFSHDFKTCRGFQPSTSSCHLHIFVSDHTIQSWSNLLSIERCNCEQWSSTVCERWSSSSLCTADHPR
jgi:hypothetical protein